MVPRAASDHVPAPLPAVLVLTALSSLGTGVFWHGLPFIAWHRYGFTQTANLGLYAIMGLVYMIGAFQAGRLTRWAERWLTPRGTLAVVVAAQALVCTVPIAFGGCWAFWVTALLGTFLWSIVWPIMESYVTAGRHGPQMRSAIGWFNLTWAPSVALPLFLMAPILEHHGEWAIGGLALTNVLALATLTWFPRRPAHHDPQLALEHVPAEYGLLLRSARVLLPLSYVLTSAMMPILPYRFDELGLEVWWETPAAATWTVVRFLAFAAMWRMAFWHGRWGTLLAGATAMTGGFALIVLAPSLPIILAGFGILGAGVGIVYYAALYYAMAVGRAAVEASGTHEGLIGAGYAVGPSAGLLGARAGGAGIVGVVWALILVAGVPALRPYLAARRLRNELDATPEAPPAS